MASLPDSRTIYAAVSVSAGALLLGVVFWNFGNTDPMWAIAAFMLVHDPDLRSAYGAGISRMLCTLLGCVLSLGLILTLGLHKWLMPLSLGLTVFLCGYVFGFRGAWRALLVCVTLVIGSSLIDPSGDIHIAATRAVEVAAGSGLAILFSLPFGYFSRRSKRPSG